ncbi:MAG TPA: hypothetical protein VMR88_02410 [Candidatus Polarisedimenticolaceae bacterium]|nr:hypothetical protein [Candidatus Polarisedimenticolaceae bacterium]
MGYRINTRFPVLVFVAAFCIWPAIASAETDKVPDEIIEQAASAGKVLVLVGLNVPWTMEGTLTDNEIVNQRRSIGSAQNDLLTQLSGTDFRVIRVYDSIPGIALEVGNEALAVLRKSTSVSNVLPDRPTNPALSPGEIEGTSTKGSGKDQPGNPGVVPIELFIEAMKSGAVLVLVGLKTPWSPEGRLSKEMVAAQRGAIAAAQNYLLTELGDTDYRITRRYRAIPGIALEVGLDALKVLARSVAVTNVLHDRPAISAR